MYTQVCPPNFAKECQQRARALTHQRAACASSQGNGAPWGSRGQAVRGQEAKSPCLITCHWVRQSHIAWRCAVAGLLRADKGSKS